MGLFWYNLNMAKKELDSELSQYKGFLKLLGAIIVPTLFLVFLYLAYTPDPNKLRPADTRFTWGDGLFFASLLIFLMATIVFYCRKRKIFISIRKINREFNRHSYGWVITSSICFGIVAALSALYTGFYDSLLRSFTRLSTPSEIINFRSLAFGLAGITGLTLAGWRSRVAERRAEAVEERRIDEKKESQIMEERRLDERFANAVESLSKKLDETSYPAHLGAITALRNLAIDEIDYTQSCFDILCSCNQWMEGYLDKVANNHQDDCYASRHLTENKRIIPNGKRMESPIKLEHERRSQQSLMAIASAINKISKDHDKKHILEELDLSGKMLCGINLSDTKIARANFEKAYLNGANLSKANLQKANLNNANLQGAILSYTNLQGAKMSKINLQGANMNNANFQESNLIEAKMQSGTLFCTQLQGANLNNADLREADLNQTQMQGAELYNTQMQGADLNQTQMQGAALYNTQMQGANLNNADLREADLYQTQMQGAELYNTQMQGADLNQTQMQGAALYNTQMQGANLNNADLREADLYQTQMQGAELYNTQMQGADLNQTQMRGAELYNTQMQGAKLYNTQMQGTKLIHTQMQGADLNNVNLQGAKLLESILQGISLFQVNLQGAILLGCNLYGAELQDNYLSNIMFDAISKRGHIKNKKQQDEWIKRVHDDFADEDEAEGLIEKMQIAWDKANNNQVPQKSDTSPQGSDNPLQGLDDLQSNSILVEGEDRAWIIDSLKVPALKDFYRSMVLELIQELDLPAAGIINLISRSPKIYRHAGRNNWAIEETLVKIWDELAEEFEAKDK